MAGRVNKLSTDEGVRRPRASSFSAMPHASPGVGECAICFEVVPCVKVLDCGHSLCTQCASKMIQASGDDSILCAECRQPTNVASGLDDLPMRYFGKVRCDLCLEKKATEDMWWCGECVRALCSKCSIKEHASRRHTISEWNTNDPVRYTVNYINNVEFKRQMSGGSRLNQNAVRTYMSEVERELMKALTTCPQLEEIKQNILLKYGTRFSTDTEDSASPLSSDEHGEESSRVVAKILQLAGTNVNRIPDTVAPDAFQVFFGVTPRDVADLLRQHIRLLPVSEADEEGAPGDLQGALEAVIGSSEDAASANDQHYLDQPASTANARQRKQSEAHSGVDRKSIPRVLGALYSQRLDTVVLRLPDEVQLYDMSSGTHQCSVSVSRAARMVRSASLANGELVLCLQNVQRCYEWTLEAYRPGDTQCNWTAVCDIDPDDYVSDVKLAAGHQCLYQLRICQQTVSEIWKTVLMGKNKMGNTKLKETLIYQKGDSQISDMAAYEYGKDKYLIVWDDLSSCLYRLIVNKDGRCQLQTTIMHSVHPIAFSLDLRQHLWLYDPHMERICRSKKPISSRQGVSLQTVAKYKENVVRCMDTSAGGDTAFGVATTANTVDLLTFVISACQPLDEIDYSTVPEKRDSWLKALTGKLI